MADGALTLTLDDETAARLETAARQAGLTPEAYAAATLSDALETWPPGAPYDTTEAERRLAEYDRTGEYVTLEDAMARFEEELQSRLAAKR